MNAPSTAPTAVTKGNTRLALSHLAQRNELTGRAGHVIQAPDGKWREIVKLTPTNGDSGKIYRIWLEGRSQYVDFDQMTPDGKLTVLDVYRAPANIPRRSTEFSAVSDRDAVVARLMRVAGVDAGNVVIADALRSAFDAGRSAK